jgi:phage shock protein PspC (stress-responsive transcriptional regulator)
MNATAPPTPPGPQPPPPHARRPLRRDRSHRMLGGVAAGIARTYGLDIVLVRVLWVIAGFLWIGIPAYVVAWIAIPGDSDDGSFADERPRDAGMIVALALIGVGVLIFFQHIVPGGWAVGGRLAGPLLLIAAGVTILILRRPGASAQPLTTDVFNEPWSLPQDPNSPVAAEPPGESSSRADSSGESVMTGGGAGGGAATEETASAWTQTAPWPTVRDTKREMRRERRRQRPRPFLGPLTVSLLLIGAGITSALAATDTVDVNITVAFAVATGFVGLMLVLSAWVGRAHGLIFLGVFLLAATAVTSALDVPLRGGFGDEQHHPTQAATLQSSYELGVGRLWLNLRDMAPADLNTTIKATVGAGRLEVDVPAGVQVVVDAKVGAGSIQLFGHHDDGWHRHVHRTVGANLEDVLHLNLQVGAGEIDVHRFLPDGSEILTGAP